MIDIIMRLRGITNEDIRAALKEAGYELSAPQVSRLLSGQQGVRDEYVDVIVRRVGLPRDELWSEVDPEQAIAKIRELSKESTPATQDLTSDASEPDYSAAEAAKLRVIRSITYQGPDAVERVVAPMRLAASDPTTWDASEHGTVSIPLLEASVKNRPIYPAIVTGTSMNRIFEPGDIAFYKLATAATKGRIYIVAVHGGVTMKRFDGEKLVPDSTDHTSAIDLLDDSKLIGEVVAIHKPNR